MMNNRYNIALSFWTSGLQYLNLVENISKEIESSDNIWVMIDYIPINPSDWEEKTRWSDYRLIIPLLFNLYHGLELIIKGFLILKSKDKINKTHNISDLVRKFEIKYPLQLELTEFYNKYTSLEDLPDILRRFIDDNKISIDSLYQSFRYPSPDFEIVRNYVSLKYQGKVGTKFYKDLNVDIKIACKNIVKLGRSLEPKWNSC